MTWPLALVAGIATALVLNELAAALVEAVGASELSDETQGGDWIALPDDFPRSDGG